MRVDKDESYEPRTTGRSAGAAVLQVERRRRWSDEQELAVLRETTEPGVIVSMVARRYGINTGQFYTNTGQFYTWRKQLLQGAMSGFILVDLTPPPTAPDPSIGTIRITGRTGLSVVIDRLVDRDAKRDPAIIGTVLVDIVEHTPLAALRWRHCAIFHRRHPKGSS